MMRSLSIGWGLAALLAVTATAYAADPPAGAPAATPVSAQIKTDDNPPMVPPPGRASSRCRRGRQPLPSGGRRPQVHVPRRHREVSRLAGGGSNPAAKGRPGYSFVELRGKGETANPAPKPDATALRHSFQMPYFRPVWRYKGWAAWKTWSPFTAAAFPDDIKNATDFEVSADIVVHKGMMDDTNALSFEAGAVDDLLVNQVSPPT